MKKKVRYTKPEGWEPKHWPLVLAALNTERQHRTEQQRALVQVYRLAERSRKLKKLWTRTKSGQLAL